MAELAEQRVNFEIKLNEVFVGKRTLRYIYLYDPDVVSTEWDETSQCTPLFLGSDVLADCNITSGNWPRFHAKHAKRGLATKVNFPPGCKVLGIHGTARGVWFYNIQGLFKIAFDCYSREDQKGCLRELQVVWQRQILDPILKNEIQVVMRKETKLLLEPESELTPHMVDENKINPQNMDIVKVTVEQIHKTIDSFSETDDEILQQELSLLKTYTSLIILKNNPDSFVSKTVNLLKSLLGLVSESSDSSAKRNNFFIRNDNFSERNNDFSEKNNSFSERNNDFSERNDKFSERNDNFSERNDKFSETNDNFSERNDKFSERNDNFSERNDKFSETNDNFSERNDKFLGRNDNFSERNTNFSERNIVMDKEAILSEIAQWLGTEFANYQDLVNEKVTAFKQKHIRSIENLPTAEDLVSEVFPNSMQVLLRCWLQLPASGDLSSENENLEGAPMLFPVVQLILELANRSLLSGVAHVLYSRLIRSESV